MDVCLLLQLLDLLKCKEIMQQFITIEDNPVFEYLLNNWSKMDEILKVLKTFYDVTINLQKVDCTLSDFYGEWLVCELKLKILMNDGQLKTNLCNKFVWSMEKRAKDIIKHRGMLCAVFLDPRYRCNLSTSEIALVKHLLEDAWLEMKKMKEAQTVIDLSDGDGIVLADGDGDLREDLLEAYLQQSSSCLDATNSNDMPEVIAVDADYSMSIAEFMISISNYEENTRRIHHSESIRKFWETNKNVYPELYQVAMVYLAIPPTQSTVERSFSALSFVFNNRRTKLCEENLENIMLMKLNKELVFEIFDEELNEMKGN